MMPRLHEIPEYLDYLGSLEDRKALPQRLLTAVMMAESGGDPGAVSPKGAHGAFQFIPKTAREYGINPRDPIQAAEGAARYLRKSLDTFGGNIPKAVASYNAGVTGVKRRGIGAAEPNYVNRVLNFLIPSAEAAEPPRPDAEPNFDAMSIEELKTIAGPPRQQSDDFDSMSIEELKAIAGPPGGASGRPEAGILDVARNVGAGALRALGDIPAGLAQISSRYGALSLSPELTRATEEAITEYERSKKAALARPGGTAGYVGGQLATAFLPGTGPLKAVSGLAAATRPIAAGAALTALKPYESEAGRLKEIGISAALGATAPGVSAIAKTFGGKIRPTIDSSFIAKLKAAPQSAKKGELLESANELGVNISPGRTAGGLPKYLEEQMVKLPGSRAIAEAADREGYESFHRAIGREMGIENSPYITADVIEAAKLKLSEAYNEILPQASVRAKTAAAGKLSFEANKLASPFSTVVAATIKKSELRELEGIRDGVIAGIKEGGIPGEDLKVLLTRVRELGEDKTLHNAVRERIIKFKGELGDTLAKSLDETNPELAQQLRLTDQQWANAKLIEDVQTTSKSVEGFVSGPGLYNKIVTRYKNPSKAGNLGKLGEIGKMFYAKGPDSGTADRWLANTILTGGILGGGASSGLLDPTTAVGLGAAPLAAASAYYGTPKYKATAGLVGAAARAASRIGGAGVGRGEHD